MSKTKIYLFHELSSIFPLMEGEDFDALVEDIREKGQLKKGILFEEKIIDGRNRYRACSVLKIPFKTEEYSEKISPRDYIISENLHRRHLTTAQRAEIGLILLEEEEKKAKERMKIKAKASRPKGSTKFEKPIKSSKPFEDLDEVVKPKEGGTSVEIVAPKVKVSHFTLSKAKKIREVAEGYKDKKGKEHLPDKSIAEKWEDAKRGKTTVDAVYKEVKRKEDIEKLPEPLKKEVEKEELTVKEAKDVAKSFKEPEKRKEAIKVIKKEKKEHKRTMDYISDVITGKEKSPTKVYKSVDQRVIKQFQGIAKQMVMKMTMGNVNSYSESTQPILIKIMKKCFEHLQNELKMKEIIDA